MPKRHEIPPYALGTRCVPIFIPDSPEYAQLLVFAIRKMCQQNYYVRDDTGTLAKETADRLKEVTLQPLIDNLLLGFGCDEMPTDCAEVADCLETNDIIQNLITQNNLYMASYNTTNISLTETINDRSTPTQRETPLEALPPPPVGETCNYDALWSGVLSVINYLDTITVDFLEQVTASSDQNERYASWVKGLPFIGALPIDEALEYTTYITQELENSYNGVVTLEFKQAIACEIFCLLQENCDSLSPQFLMDYLFYTRLGIDPITVATYSIAPLVGFPIELLLQGADMAIGMWGIAIWMTQAQANFYGGFGAKNLTIAYKSGLNSPDNDWSLLCECVPDFWVQEFDFTVSQSGFTRTNGTWVSGEGFMGQFVGSSAYYVLGTIPFTQYGDVTKITLEYKWVSLQANRGIDQYLYNPSANLVSSVLASFLNTGINTIEVNVSQSANNYGVWQRQSANGQFYLRKVTFEGTGVNPF